MFIKTPPRRLRTEISSILPGDDFLCLKRFPPLAREEIFKARAKGAKTCFSIHAFDYPWVQGLDLSAKERIDFVDDYYGPWPKIDVFAITGTNGKTSTTCLLQRAFEKAQRKMFLTGTIGWRNHSSSVWGENSLTTPDYAQLRSYVADASRQGYDSFVLEASSHALDQNRLGTIPLCAAGSTAVTFDDHLDYHLSPLAYLQSKAKLFQRDGHYAKILDYRNPLKQHLGSNIILKDLYEPIQKNLTLNVAVQLPNLRLAQYLLESQGLPVPPSWSEWVMESHIIGRSQLFDWPGDRLVMVDFAHTPAGILHVLSACKSVHLDELWVVFGAGGRRDRRKRPQMASIARQYSDKVIITQDNSRGEPFEQIVADMQLDDDQNIYVEPNRAHAIALAFELAPRGAMIVIAGKGHEQYQEEAGRKVAYCDRKEVLKYQKESSHA